MNKGFFYWGTRDGFQNNICDNKVPDTVLQGISNYDDIIRSIRSRGTNSLVEYYYALIRIGDYFLATLVDPTKKDYLLQV